jgi:23S rRNA (guanosine2251-2'-O)-methyltransferase
MSSQLEKLADTIGREKFTRLSSIRQHEYLALLARKTLESGDFKGFIKRYNEMQSWVELDKYTPPAYLTEEEAAHEYLLFHSGFSTNPGIHKDNEYTLFKAEAVSWEPRFDVTIVLDQVRSPYNTGSVLRLIDNFGFRKLVHNAEWLRLDHPQLCRAARGAQNWIPVEHKPNLTEWIKSLNMPVIGIENSDDAILINDWRPEKPCVLIIGNEVYGIAKRLRDQCRLMVKIPMFGFKQSMNLHHALAIACYKITSKT